MNQKLGTIALAVHSNKNSNRVNLEDFLHDEEINMKVEDFDDNIFYIGYEILIYVDLFFDGSFKIVKLYDGKNEYFPK